MKKKMLFRLKEHLRGQEGLIKISHTFAHVNQTSDHPIKKNLEKDKD